MLGFNEFKSAEGAMSFLFCDASKLIDIVENRCLSLFKSYFIEVRERVTHVIMDKYPSYMTLIKKVFSNTKIVLDQFHIL